MGSIPTFGKGYLLPCKIILSGYTQNIMSMKKMAIIFALLFVAGAIIEQEFTFKGLP